MKTLFNILLLVVLACCHSHHDHDHHDHDHDHDHDHGQEHHHNHKHGHGHGPNEVPPVTKSASGEFRGGYNVTRLGRKFETYRGIRYAEPPVGELRFQPPKLITEYKTPVDASEDGPACPLPAPPGYYVDEDCLTINVYTPLKKDRKEPLPVIFFIHAGGFYTMSGRSDLAGPHYLLDRDIVLVTINYRLGSLGFLSTGDELAPGNNGYKDQVAALKWVQRNIAAFGGDPASVTIAGCSAGSFSVMLHMISPMSKGLFHRGISMSGSPINIKPTPDNMYSLAVKQAELLNCPTTDSKAIIDCLKTKSWRDLGNSLLGFYEFGFDPVGIWMPVVEKDFGQERFLPIDPVKAIKEGKMHAVPYIVSQTRDEFFWMAYTVLRNQTLLDRMNSEWESIAPISFLLPRDARTSSVTRALRTTYLHDKALRNDKESAKNLGLLYQDSIESFPVHRLVNLMCRHSPHPVWYYEFAYVGNHSHYEDPVSMKPEGAAHHDDLIYLFTLSYRFPDVGAAGGDARLVDRMTALWHNFAKHGDPNHGDLPELEGVKWPRIRPDNRQYLRIDRDLSVHKNLKEDRLKFWEELYPLTY
ncbi:esterase E4-like [Vanessa atalanta]|uniref:esterase E4-like n=1 Tax=Vanessa atalanta TaxID=42275 RepID=UPI001FCDB2BF|nr:esterase E4-like [Vanessa atalanta]